MNQYFRAKSPLRISFAGGGTDIEPVFRKIGGAVLVSTIDKYSYVSISVRDDHQISIRSLDYNVEVKYHREEKPLYNGVLDLAKACIEEVGADQGLDICLQTEAPPGSGLGSSSSMITALLGGLLSRSKQHIDLYKLAEKAYDVERVKMAISGGMQDQYACAFGGFNLVEFHTNGDVEVTPLRIRPDILNDLESHCMLCFTGQTRLSANLIDKQVFAFRQRQGEAREGTEMLKVLCYEAKSLLVKGKLYEFGQMLHRASSEKKRMNPETTNEFIDALYQEARNLGALGGKILGAGGGGYLLLLVPLERKKAVKDALEAMGGRFMSFSFTRDGVQTWTSTCP